MLNVAIVGCGYWGSIIGRNLANMVDEIRIVVVCDKNLRQAENLCQRYFLDARVISNYREILFSKDIDAVFLVTPIKTHYELTINLLKAGKHVFVEKPLAQTVEQCERLINLADQKQRVLMVGHVFEYNDAVHTIKEYLDNSDIGNLFYIYGQRINLGRIQNDINALWSLAPHDISIINYWLGEEPVRISAHGFGYLNQGVQDVVFLTIDYPNNIGVHLHLSWLDPQKLRLLTLVGSKKMIVYDDVSLDSKIKIYDKGIADLHEFLESPHTFAEFQFKIRVGDMIVPALPFSEPLAVECRHFIECVKQGSVPRTDGWNGLRVVKVLQAAEKSLQSGGEPVEISAFNSETTRPQQRRKA